MDRHKDATIQSAYQIPGWMWPQELGWLYDNFRSSSSHLEVGSFCGKSLFVTACAMGRQKESLCLAVDPLEYTPIGRRWEVNVLKATIEEIKRRSKTDVKWWPIGSVEAMRRARDEELTFDSIFIDGNHHFAEVSADIEGWIPFLRAGGIIAGHDFWPKDSGVMEAVCQEFGNDFEVGPGTRIWWRRSE